ncbi:uncharacterized protein LOC129752083 [Uranotaenia lowii]|uniref:uncharacterized protein LOC129752083 n=1 Tax=Uranotaenia lowii TaxID=190385 RepID=UPI00247B1AD2|nr:uncharacterized protein LOC129752083 [Uranotaenia lowii]
MMMMMMGHHNRLSIVLLFVVLIACKNGDSARSSSSSGNGAAPEVNHRDTPRRVRNANVGSATGGSVVDQSVMTPSHNSNNNGGRSTMVKGSGGASLTTTTTTVPSVSVASQLADSRSSVLASVASVTEASAIGDASRDADGDDGGSTSSLKAYKKNSCSELLLPISDPSSSRRPAWLWRWQRVKCELLNANYSVASRHEKSPLGDILHQTSTLG